MEKVNSTSKCWPWPWTLWPWPSITFLPLDFLPCDLDLGPLFQILNCKVDFFFNIDFSDHGIWPLNSFEIWCSLINLIKSKFWSRCLRNFGVKNMQTLVTLTTSSELIKRLKGYGILAWRVLDWKKIVVMAFKLPWQPKWTLAGQSVRKMRVKNLNIKNIKRSLSHGSKFCCISEAIPLTRTSERVKALVF